jgi:hypothetical protein
MVVFISGGNNLEMSGTKCDREICFKWFSKLMTDDPDLEPDMNKTFFVDYITKLDPKLLTDSGIRCFERFFKNVNLKYNHLVQKRHWSLAANGSLNLISSKNEQIHECLMNNHLNDSLISKL